MWVGPRQRAWVADPDRRGGRAYRRLLPAQRLVGARHPGVGISAARAVPGQEFPDQRVARGWSPPRRWRRSARRCRRGPRAIPSRCPISTIRRPRARRALAIQLEVTLTTEKMRAAGLAPHMLSRGSADAAMYWSAAQIVTHHSANGCNLQPGDLIGTGTLSTDSAGGLGSLLEISQGGKQPIAAAERRNAQLPRGRRRGDAASAWCEARRRGADRLRRMRRPGGCVSLGRGSPPSASSLRKAGRARRRDTRAPRNFARRAEQGFELDRPAGLDVLQHRRLERAEPRR